MRWIFFILLLANMIFFGFTQLSAGPGEEAAKDHQPLNGDKISVIAVSAPVELSQSVVPATPPKQNTVCLEWGIFSGAELERALLALEKMQIGDKVSQHPVEEANRYWVYIPPLKAKESAEKKIAELKALGIKDYELIKEDGAWKNAISLGVFKSEDASLKYLAQMRQQGVNSAKAGPRLAATGEVKLLIKDAGDDIAAKMVVLKQDFQGSELKAVGCQ